MAALIPLRLDVRQEPGPYDAIGALEPPFDPIPAAVKRTVHARDRHGCRFCGFTSPKYQQAVALSGHPWDVDGVVTACIFCQQAACLDMVPAMRSGVLVWLPEVPQSRLHHIAREIYVWRITSGIRAERARRVLDRLMARRKDAKEQAGTDDPLELAQRLRKLRQGRPDPELEAALPGLRLFPLDRRIVREVDLEYNQFPQILAFWRSRNGPFSTGPLYPGVAEIEPVLLDAAERAAIADALAASGGQAAGKGTPHKLLAARLLRDAAGFFRRLAGNNPGIAGEMADNARVFDEVAYLVEAAPERPPENARESHASLAAKLLRDAATFFRSLAEHNEPLREQMTENATVFDHIAKLVEEDPEGLLP